MLCSYHNKIKTVKNPKKRRKRRRMRQKKKILPKVSIVFIFLIREIEA